MMWSTNHPYEMSLNQWFWQNARWNLLSQNLMYELNPVHMNDIFEKASAFDILGMSFNQHCIWLSFHLQNETSLTVNFSSSCPE